VRVLELLLLLLATWTVAPAVVTVVHLLSASEAVGVTTPCVQWPSQPVCRAGVARFVWLPVCVCLCKALRVCHVCEWWGA
jgi:hypothetical protein